MADFECFESAGYRVRVVKGSMGQFPQIDDGNSIFEYNICKFETRPIKYVTMLFPNNCDPELQIIDSFPPCEAGCGHWNCENGGDDPQECVRPYDLLTGLGRWQNLLDVYRWDAPWSSHRYGGRFSLTVEGSRVAGQTAMVIKTHALLPRKWGSGNILGPACFDTGDPVSEFIPFSKTADGVTCKGRVHFQPSFYIEVTEAIGLLAPGEEEPCAVGPIFPIENLQIGSSPSGSAIDLQKGWFGFHGSPAKYCYYNKKKKKYQCVTY
jgi:hypothetical protein